MNRSYIWQLLVFVIVLVLLNLLFEWHISIVGSIVLTLVLNLVLSQFGRR